MTDAHCHVSCGDAAVREFLIGRDFEGVHPWHADEFEGARPALRQRLEAEPKLGVGEIGLDRLRARDVSTVMRSAFEEQLRLAAAFGRPVVLHGAKCWGQVVETIRRLFPTPASRPPAFLFHGFSRAEGLLPEIAALNGFVSVGPAVLNGHAANYRKLVAKIPCERLLLETDRTVENAATCPEISAVAAGVAAVRGEDIAALERLADANAERFVAAR